MINENSSYQNSLHDVIFIHERIRENLRYKKDKKDFKKIIFNIYENDGLIKKIRSKGNISLDKLTNIINEIIDFNKNVEKDENVAKLNI